MGQHIGAADGYKDLSEGEYGAHKWYDPYSGQMGEAGPNYPGNIPVTFGNIGAADGYIIPTSNSHLTALIRAILKNEHYPYWGISPISKMNIIPTCHPEPA